MAIEEMKVSELISSIHQDYHIRLKKLHMENAELRLYKEALKAHGDKTLLEENISLKKEVSKLRAENDCWKKYGAPF